MKPRHLLATLALSLGATPALAADDREPAGDVPATDALFPGAGRASLAISTGVPFLAMGELGYGVTSHFAVGLLAGVTPKVSGFGLRPRVELPLSDHLSLLGMASALYYPPSSMSREWLLARPSALLERRFAWGNLALGSGIVAAATTDALFGAADESHVASSPYPSSTPRRFDSGVWLTANAIGSVRLARNTHGFVDGAFVFNRSLELATRDWIGGPPLIVFLGVETAL